jgi:hypothetical protein
VVPPERGDIGGVVGRLRELLEAVRQRPPLGSDEHATVETETIGEGELEQQGAADVA